MSRSFDTTHFAERLRQKRRPTGLRETAKQAGVSASTLSRLGRGETPDLATFCRVCDWVEISPGCFFQGTPQIADEPLSTPKRIVLLLYQDAAMPRDLVEALVSVVRLCRPGCRSRVSFPQRSRRDSSGSDAASCFSVV